MKSRLSRFFVIVDTKYTGHALTEVRTFHCKSYQNVSKYTIEQLDTAQHTDELVTDGNIHLRIDYKNSGIGSGSCGPLTGEEFRVSEKKINFAFSVKPI